jgi:lysophospholipase L1-like esterase
MGQPQQHSARNRQRFATRAITAAVSLLVALVCVEIGTRVFLRRHWDTAVIAAASARINIRSLITFVDDKELLYGLRPGLDAPFLGTRVLTNAEGDRVGTTNPAPAGPALRIALIGDSTPFGWRVEYSECYGELLRRKLEELSGAAVLLENFSVPGYNAGQELELLRTRVLAWHPDLVLLHHDHNDAQPTGWGYGAWAPPEYGDNVLHSAALKVLLRKWRTRGGPETRRSADARDEVLDGYCVAGPSYDAMLELRRSLVQAATAKGVPVLVLLFNAEVKADDAYAASPTYLRLHKSLQTRLGEMGYLVLDLYPDYQEWLKQSKLADMSSLWSDAEDHHPNARGHALLADFILRYIEDSPRLRELFSRKR